MFFKITAVFSLFLLLFLTAAYSFFARLDPTLLPEYQKLVRDSVKLRSQSTLERQPAYQVRKEVQKDIWTYNNEKRLHYRLKAQRSELAILEAKGKIDLKENLETIECCLQEEIGDNSQQIRYIFAPQGIYLFPAHRFTTDEAKLHFFSLPGTDLPTSWPTESPFLRGRAREVIFSAGLGLPSFTAYHLNAELISPNDDAGDL